MVHKIKGKYRVGAAEGTGKVKGRKRPFPSAPTLHINGESVDTLNEANGMSGNSELFTRKAESFLGT